MMEYSDSLLSRPRRTRAAKLRPIALVAIPLAAILFQVYVPLFFKFLGYLELPLLVTVYFALMKRAPIPAVFFGAIVGLAQDSLASPKQPLGMYGIVNTLVGYFAASVSLRFDVDNSVFRFVLGFFFFVFHQFFYWVLARALLGLSVFFDLQQTLLLAVLNAAVGVPLFHVLDKMKVTT